MYGTARKGVGTIWGADQYNISFDQEIGHFQHCNGAAVPATPFGSTPRASRSAARGPTPRRTASRRRIRWKAGMTTACFPESESQLVRVQGCTDTNTGFDGVSYHPVWPDGNTALHPTPARFTSPLTGPKFNEQYGGAALSTDLPRHRDQHLQSGDGRGMHPASHDRRRYAGVVLSLLLDRRRPVRLCLAARRDDPGDDEQLRWSGRLRVAAQGALPDLWWPREDAPTVQHLPQSVAEQPLPGVPQREHAKGATCESTSPPSVGY